MRQPSSSRSVRSTLRHSPRLIVGGRPSWQTCAKRAWSVTLSSLGTSYILHPTSHILHLTSYILHLTSYILQERDAQLLGDLKKVRQELASVYRRNAEGGGMRTVEECRPSPRRHSLPADGGRRSPRGTTSSDKSSDVHLVQKTPDGASARGTASSARGTASSARGIASSPARGSRALNAAHGAPPLVVCLHLTSYILHLTSYILHLTSYR